MHALQIFPYKLLETNINLTCDIFPVEVLKKKEKTVPEKKGTSRIFITSYGMQCLDFICTSANSKVKPSCFAAAPQITKEKLKPVPKRGKPFQY